MTRFEATNDTTDVVAADRSEVWAVLTDPDALVQLTPLVRRIEADGEQWVWHLFGISALGVEIAPSFTETMAFTPEERIEFSHTPPAGQAERAGADGVYTLTDTEGGTRLAISITIHVELPLPGMSRGAVERVMEQSMHRTGQRFGRNLLDHLDVPAEAR